MKKFFGIIFVIAGSLWTLISLLVFSAGDATELFVSIVFVALGVVGIIIGVKMIRAKKPASKHPVPNRAEQSIAPPKPQTPSSASIPQSRATPKPQKENKPLTLKEIRAITAEKVNELTPSAGKVTANQLIESLFSVNDYRLPFEFRQSNQKGVNMVAHWKMADVDYLGILGLNKHNIQARFDILMKFDELNSIVRCKDRLYRKESSFGLGGMGMEMSSFSGKATSKQKEIVIGRKKDGSIGKVVDIALDTSILQNAIKIIADKNGWETKRVVGKL